MIGFGSLADGRAYQVMELVEGPSLSDYLADGGPPPIAEALRMLEEIAAALDAAHGAGIIHRDLKPSNILLASSAGRMRPMLADFGIAKALEEDSNQHLTRTGTTLGTPAYMSPEQALGREVGVASDVYSFGVVAYELLAGRVPFEGESPLETMMMHVQTPAAAPSTVEPLLGDRFDAAIAWLLAKHPGERPATPAEAMAALRSDSERARHDRGAAEPGTRDLDQRERADRDRDRGVRVARPELGARPASVAPLPVASPLDASAVNASPVTETATVPTEPVPASGPATASKPSTGPAAHAHLHQLRRPSARPHPRSRPPAGPTPSKDSLEVPPDYAP